MNPRNVVVAITEAVTQYTVNKPVNPSNCDIETRIHLTRCRHRHYRPLPDKGLVQAPEATLKVVPIDILSSINLKKRGTDNAGVVFDCKQVICGFLVVIFG